MKDYLKIILGLVMGTAIFALICKGLNFILVTDDPWHRSVASSYYKQKNIDNIYVGSSVVYFGVDPNTLDQLNGMDNFNVSSPGQRWDTSYHLLVQTISDHKPDNVYLECYCWCLGEYEAWIEEDKQYKVIDYIDDPMNFTRPWQITYEMKPSFSKLAINATSYEPEHMLDTLFPFVRYRGNLFNWDEIEKNISDKTSDEYKNNSCSEEGTDIDGSVYKIEYAGKGYFDTDAKLYDREKLIEQTRIFTNNDLGPRSEEYLRKSIELCKSNGIGVKLFVAPIYDLQLLSTEDYDAYLDELKKISDETGVELYDFNLIKDEYLNIKNSDYYMDMAHLNGAGADLFTPALWDVLGSSEEENIHKFHDSYEDKLSSEPPEIYGLYYDDINPGEGTNPDGSPIYTTRHYTIAANRDMEYRIAYSIWDGDAQTEDQIVVVQDQDRNNEFDIPIGLSGQIMIEGNTGSDQCSITVDYY